LSIDNRESATLPIWYKTADRLIAKLLVDSLAGDGEQAVLPRGDKHCWRRHDDILWVKARVGGKEPAPPLVAEDDDLAGAELSIAAIECAAECRRHAKRGEEVVIDRA
jgi:hypothetical protein